jgi:hypothetical protein
MAAATMTMVAMIMLAAPVAVLDVARLPTRATHKGGTSGEPGDKTPPPSGPKEGKGQCPPTPKKPTQEEGDKPAHLTTEEWAAFNRAEEFKYSTAFKRYICANGNQT